MFLLIYFFSDIATSTIHQKKNVLLLKSHLQKKKLRLKLPYLYKTSMDLFGIKIINCKFCRVGNAIF